MKTSEFIRYFEGEGYRLFNHYGVIVFEDSKGNEALEIDSENNVNTLFYDLPFSKQQEYYKVIFEYLITPNEEREEEKRYYLKHKGIYNDCLIYDERTERYYTAYENTMAYQNSKTQFTQKEIDNMPECYTHPAVWEQVLVEE